MLGTKLKFARKVHPDDRRAELKHKILTWIFPCGRRREITRLGATLEMWSRNTTSGVEYSVAIYRFASWSYEIIVWRAG